MISSTSSQIFRKRLLGWYDRHRRDLPWRLPFGAPPDAKPNSYHVLVSEAMLQQTQVAAVIPYFERFLEKFPTLRDLAAADEQDVLRLWQGLGYYSRARNLRAAARKVIAEFDAKIPSEVTELLGLPGIGRYTAGAISSIAFGKRSPIVDGNVARVLCRLDKIETDPRGRATQERLWKRAEEILPRARVGDFNSALMELGATVCTPRSPKCLTCPVQRCCKAFAAGLQEKIPAPRETRKTPLLERQTYCIRRDGRWLIEQRPLRGRWAGLWQFVTMATTGATLPLKTEKPKSLGTVTHALTHRRYRFEVFTCDACGNGKMRDGATRAWASLDELDRYPLPKPHLRIAQMLRKYP